MANAKTPDPAGAGSGVTGRTVSRVLFEAYGFPRRLRWSSVWDGCRQPPQAAYPRLPSLALGSFGVGHTSPLIWPCSDRGLPCPLAYARGGGLLPHRFTLTRRSRGGRFVFCGPVRRLSAPRCYLAVCPLELGLSSRRLPGTRPSRPACASKDNAAAGQGPVCPALPRPFERSQPGTRSLDQWRELVVRL